MSPDAPTSPPGGASGLKIYGTPEAWKSANSIANCLVTAVEPNREDAHLASAAARRALPTHGTFRRQTMVRKLITIIALTGSLAIAACNTVEGAGKDVSSAGDAVSDAAK
jgi:predicted small secreted protein